MTITLHTDLYTPEFFAEEVSGVVNDNLVMTNSAVVRGDLVGKPGTTVVLPKYNKIGKAEKLTEGVAMVSEALSQSSRSATVESFGKSIDISDFAQLTGVGNAQSEAVAQLGEVIAELIDEELYKAALEVITDGIKQAKGTPSTDSKPFVLNAGTGVTINYDSLIDATALAGAKFKASEWDVYVNSGDRARIMKDDLFIAAAQGAGANGLVTNGAFGALAGMSTLVSDLIEPGVTVLIRKGTLALWYKATPIVEQQRDAKALVTTYVTSVHFATGRVSDTGVVKINWDTAAV